MGRKITAYAAVKNEAARLVKRQGERAFAGARLQHGKPAAVCFRQEYDERPAVSAAAAFRKHRQILDFKHAASFVGNDALRLYAAVFEHVQYAALQIAVYH